MRISRSNATARLATIVLVWVTWAVASLVATPVAFATAPAELQRVAELRESDPQAALALVERLRVEYPRDDSVALSLLESLGAAGESSRALELANELLEVDVAASDAVKVLRVKVEAMGDLQRYEDLVDVTERGLGLARSLRDEAALELVSSLAFAYYGQADYARAASIYEELLAIRGDVVDEEQERYLGNLGAMYAQSGDHADAVDVLLRALSVAEQLGKDEAAMTLRNLGGLYINLGEYELSLIYSRRALAAVAPDSTEAASLLGNIGVALQNLERFDEARESYEQALAVSDSLGLDNASSLNNLAYLLHEEGRHRESLELLDRALVINEASQRWDLVAIVKKNQGENWVALGERERAAELFEEAHRHYLEYDLRANRLELYPVMIDNLEGLGRYERALELMREYKTVYDETVSVESVEKVAELRARYDLERQQSAKDAQLEALENSRDVERSVRVVLVAVLALVSVIAFLLLRSLHFRGRANRVLESKNLEIASQTRRLRELNESLVQQSREDELTGLLNRRFLSEHLRKEIPHLERIVERGGQVEQLLIVADLDHFKRINDRFGHAAGDRVLKAFADTLTSCARESDYCVRWGGEEFLWLCRDATTDDGAALGRRLLGAVERLRVPHGDEELSVTCSIGMAPFPLWPSRQLDWELTLAAADAALYAAKRSGRNRWCSVRSKRGPVRPDPVDPGEVERLIESGELVLETDEPAGEGAA